MREYQRTTKETLKEDNELLEIFEPVLRFSAGERFFPMNVQDYLVECLLVEASPLTWGRNLTEKWRQQGGDLATALGTIYQSSKYYLQFIFDEKSREPNDERLISQEEWRMAPFVLGATLLLLVVVPLYGLQNIQFKYFPVVSAGDTIKMICVGLFMALWPAVRTNRKAHLAFAINIFGSQFFGTDFGVAAAATALVILTGFIALYAPLYLLWEYREKRILRTSWEWGKVLKPLAPHLLYLASVVVTIGAILVIGHFQLWTYDEQQGGIYVINDRYIPYGEAHLRESAVSGDDSAATFSFWGLTAPFKLGWVSLAVALFGFTALAALFWFLTGGLFEKLFEWILDKRAKKGSEQKYSYFERFLLWVFFLSKGVRREGKIEDAYSRQREEELLRNLFREQTKPMLVLLIAAGVVAGVFLRGWMVGLLHHDGAASALLVTEASMTWIIIGILSATAMLWFALDPLPFWENGVLAHYDEQHKVLAWNGRLLLAISAGIFFWIFGSALYIAIAPSEHHVHQLVIYYLFVIGGLFITGLVLGSKTVSFFLDLVSSHADIHADYAARKYNDIASRKKGRFWYYGRVCEGQGWTALQYHYFYAFNDYRSTANGLNNHEGDWETISIYLKERENTNNNPGYVLTRQVSPETVERLSRLQPYGVAYSQHHTGEFVFWEDVKRVEFEDGVKTLHPLVYAALGSHANYPAPQEYPTSEHFTGLTYRLVSWLDKRFRQLNDHVGDLEKYLEREKLHVEILREKGQVITGRLEEELKAVREEIEYLERIMQRSQKPQETALQVAGQKLEVTKDEMLHLQKMMQQMEALQGTQRREQGADMFKAALESLEQKREQIIGAETIQTASDEALMSLLKERSPAPAPVLKPDEAPLDSEFEMDEIVQLRRQFDAIQQELEKKQSHTAEATQFEQALTPVATPGLLLEYATGDGLRIGFSDERVRYEGECKLARNLPRRIAARLRESATDGKPRDMGISLDWAHELIVEQEGGTGWTQFKGLWGRKALETNESGPSGPKWVRSKGEDLSAGAALASALTPDEEESHIRLSWRLYEWKDALLLEMANDKSLPVGRRLKALHSLVYDS
ncbi:MAG: hypothetical protein JXA78_05765 [Anaerolineales bacterium]|nr:hypothetical protein [Anaerolineales bacterium]